MPIRVDCFRRQSPDYHRPLAGMPDHVVITAWGITDISDAWMVGSPTLGLLQGCPSSVQVDAKRADRFLQADDSSNEVRQRRGFAVVSVALSIMTSLIDWVTSSG
jgi:hypothetical protein